ncbi:MAG: cation diffusion facilitator family transporter [Betaproteobacteria bacterium]|nr:cation diffusion facilitator family transporter [Betaproteobacteria bacterium]
MLGMALNLGFVAAEVGFGFYANSIALLADAGHNLSDVLGLGLAWGASLLARRPPAGRFTYGLRGSTIWAALANALALLVATGAIAWEAVLRIAQPAAVAGATVIAVALAGVAVNAGTAALFLRAQREDLNARGAFLHLAADAAVSLAVAGSGAAILWTGMDWIDPAMSLVVAALIVASTWGLLREALALALHSAPRSIALAEVRRYLCGLPGVAGVHDLHVWAMSTSENALTAHLVMPAGHPGDAFLERVAEELRARFLIGHPTLQVELGDPGHPCCLEPEETV